MGKSKKEKLLAQPKNWIFLPMAAVLFIVPLVMCYWPVQADNDTYRLIGSEWNVDFFSQGKAIALYVISLFSLIFIAMSGQATRFFL